MCVVIRMNVVEVKLWIDVVLRKGGGEEFGGEIWVR